MRKLAAILVALPMLAAALPGLAQEAGGQLTLSAPEQVEQSSRFEVTYSGPVEEGDQVQIAWPRTPPEVFLRHVLASEGGATKRLTAPGELGTYELRYYSPAKKAVLASRLVQVIAATISLKGPDSVGQGTTFEIAWHGPAATEDRIEIVRTGFLQSGNAPVASVRLRKDGRPVSMAAPIDPGSYELRYVTGEDEIAARQEIRVVAVRVSITPADDIVAGSPFEVRWEGPAARFDQIRLYRQDATPKDYLQAAAVWSPDRPVRLTAPIEPGRYRLAYWSARAGEALQEVTIRVRAETAEASVEGPRQVEGGSRFAVKWTGPGAPFDEIELARPEMRPGEHVSSTLVPPKGIDAVLAAPLAAGVYEIRYWSGRGQTVLAQRQIRVTTPAVSLQVSPATVRANAPFAVNWRGPNGSGDELRITEPGARAGVTVSQVLLETAGQPAQLVAPAVPGTYQLRYWSGSARAVLASAILTVE